ncbi:MAG: hypothetical protein JXB14_00135 [Candidatus Altiarchaeota archaeon]|nr:hypothetical protein [Candidatus Altiarchaeota archaeon]
MKPGRVSQYLRSSGLSTERMNHELRIRKFLETVSRDPRNIAPVGPHYSDLIGVSALIAHFLPRIKEPEEMLKAWQNAFRYRGECIFEKEPCGSAYSRLISGVIRKRGPKTALGISKDANPFARGVLFSALFRKRDMGIRRHPEEVLKALKDPTWGWAAAHALARNPEVVERYSPQLMKMLFHKQTKWAAARALAGSPQSLDRHYQELKRMASNPQTLDVASRLLQAREEHPEKPKDFRSPLQSSLKGDYWSKQDPLDFEKALDSLSDPHTCRNAGIALGRSPRAVERLLDTNPQLIADMPIIASVEIVRGLERGRKRTGPILRRFKRALLDTI